METMTYFKSGQPVPGKGMAWTIYELNDAEEISRIITFISETGEITRYPSPRMKTLFQRERLDIASEEEFTSLWNQGNE